jgi:hypothetical protein
MGQSQYQMPINGVLQIVLKVWQPMTSTDNRASFADNGICQPDIIRRRAILNFLVHSRRFPFATDILASLLAGLQFCLPVARDENATGNLGQGKRLKIWNG